MKEKKLEEAGKTAEGEEKKVEEAEKEKLDYVKDGDKVDPNKHNQALRKAREAEAEKRELEAEKKKLEDIVKGSKPTPVKKTIEKEEEEDDDDDFWGEGGEQKKKVVEKDNTPNQEELKAIINEQIRPFVEAETTRNKIEKKRARQSFYDSHPEYLSNPDKWAELLDELGVSIVPSGDYYQDLEKAHRIVEGENFNDAQIENKKKELAADAGANAGGGSAPKDDAKDYKLSELDKKIVESTGVEAETVKKMRELQKEGRISLEF